jgi:hypothetical protein
MVREQMKHAPDSLLGIQFYHMEGLGKSQHASYVQKYMAKLDALEMTEAKRTEMLECMKDVYDLLLKQLDEIAPEATTATATPLPVPVLSPEETNKLDPISLEELWRSNGSEGVRFPSCLPCLPACLPAFLASFPVFLPSFPVCLPLSPFLLPSFISFPSSLPPSFTAFLFFFRHFLSSFLLSVRPSFHPS